MPKLRKINKNMHKNIYDKSSKSFFVHWVETESESHNQSKWGEQVLLYHTPFPVRLREHLGR